MFQYFRKYFSLRNPRLKRKALDGLLRVFQHCRDIYTMLSSNEEIRGGRYSDSTGLYSDFPAYFLDMKSRMVGALYLVTKNKGERKVWQTYLTSDDPVIGKLGRKPPYWPETQDADVENAKLAIVVN